MSRILTILVQKKSVKNVKEISSIKALPQILVKIFSRGSKVPEAFLAILRRLGDLRK